MILIIYCSSLYSVFIAERAFHADFLHVDLLTVYLLAHFSNLFAEFLFPCHILFKFFKFQDDEMRDFNTHQPSQIEPVDIRPSRCSSHFKATSFRVLSSILLFFIAMLVYEYIGLICAIFVLILLCRLLLKHEIMGQMILFLSFSFVIIVQKKLAEVKEVFILSRQENAFIVIIISRIDRIIEWTAYLFMRNRTLIMIVSAKRNELSSYSINFI